MEKINEMGNFDLNWGRPLKSILCVFNKKVVNFELSHLKSSNFTYLDKDFEKKKTFNDYDNIKNFLIKLELF